MELRGRRAIVTGGAHRIGRAIVMRLAMEGVDVAVHYGSSADEAENVVQEIEKLGVKGVAIGANLHGSVANYDWVVGKVAEELGGVEILINSAAVFNPKDIDATDEEDWHLHMDINLKAPFFLSKSFAEKVGDKGHIINITDAKYVRPLATQASYILSKSGVSSMTAMLASGLAPGIQVNAVALGAILPPPGKDEKYLNKLDKDIVLKRHGNTEEVVNAIVYLLKSDFVTGEILFVDGGVHL